jgi:hypothetical protein
MVFVLSCKSNKEGNYAEDYRENWIAGQVTIGISENQGGSSLNFDFYIGREALGPSEILTLRGPGSKDSRVP